MHLQEWRGWSKGYMHLYFGVLTGVAKLLSKGVVPVAGAPASHGPQRVLSSSWVLASLVGEKSVSILPFII